MKTRMTKARRLEELQYFVAICFTLLEEDLETTDPKEFANATGLSVTTIWRLAHNQFTLAVRFGTIQALGYAAGLKMDWEKCTVSLIE